MAKILKAVIGIALTVVGFVTGNPWLIAAGAALTVASALPKPAQAGSVNQASEQRLSKNLDPEAYRKIIFGKTACALDLRYWEVFGTDNDQYDEVYAAATHRVHAYGDLYFNDEKVIGIGAVAKYNGAFTRQTSLEGGATTSVQAGAGALYDATATMLGCAHFALKYVYSQDKWPQGFPSRITQVVEGMPLYDPRRDSTVGGSGSHRADDQSTWQYEVTDSNNQPIGRNNALQVLAYLIGWRINDVLVAGRGVHLEDIDFSAFIAAANDCESNGYYSDCILSTGDSHSSNEAALSAAAGGQILDTGGRFSYVVAVDDTAQIAWYPTDDHIIGSISWVPRQKMADQFNQIAGTFIDPDALFQSRPYPLMTDEAYTTADGYKKRKSMSFGAVQDPAQAQKLTRIDLNRSRFQGIFQAEFNLAALQVKNWSLVRLTFSRYGWTNKLFRVIEQAVQPLGGVAMTLREEDPSIYAGGTVADVPPPSIGTGYDPFQKVPVTGLNAYPIVLDGENGGMSVDGVRVIWDPAPSTVTAIELRYRQNGETDWTSVKLPRDQVTYSISPLLPETFYTVEVRFISVNDVPGNWEVKTIETGGGTSIWADHVRLDETRTLADILDAIDAAGDSIAAAERATATLKEAIENSYKDAQAIISLATAVAKAQKALRALTTNADGKPLGSYVEEQKLITDDLVDFTTILGVVSGDGLSIVANTDRVQVLPGKTMADVNTELYSRMGTAESAIVSNYNTLSTADTTEATARLALASTVASNQATATSTYTTLANATSAVATELHLLGAKNGAGTLFIIDLSKAIVDGSQSLGTRLSGIDSAMGAANASISSLSTTVTNNYNSQASQINTLNTNYGSLSTTVTNNYNSLSSTTSTQGSQISTLQSNYSGLSATVSTQAGTIATLDAKASAYWQIIAAAGADPAYVRVNANGYGSDIAMAAKTIALYNTISGQVVKALEIIGGDVYANNVIVNRLQANTVQTDKIVGAAVTQTQADSASGTTYGSAGDDVQFVHNFYLDFPADVIVMGQTGFNDGGGHSASSHHSATKITINGTPVAVNAQDGPAATSTLVALGMLHCSAGFVQVTMTSKCETFDYYTYRTLVSMRVYK